MSPQMGDPTWHIRGPAPRCTEVLCHPERCHIGIDCSVVAPTLGYEVKPPEGGPPDEHVQVTIDENGYIHLVAHLTERTRASRPLLAA